MLSSKLLKFLSRIKLSLVSPVAGDGGHRRYYRLQNTSSRNLKNKKTYYILMQDIEIKKWYSKNPKKDFIFIAIQKILKKNKVAVPDIIKLFKKEACLLIEDLGDCSLQNLKKGSLAAYKKSLDQLIKIQAIKTKTYLPIFKSSFNTKFLTKELTKSLIIINNFYFPKNKRSQLSKTLKAEINKLCSRLGKSPFCLVHRDYHCRNIMIKKGQIKIIDFQDAKPGHCLYDLASLLEDPYARLTVKTKTILKNYFKKNSASLLLASSSPLASPPSPSSLASPSSSSSSPLASPSSSSPLKNFDWHYRAISLHRLLKAAASFIYLSKKLNNKVHNYQSKLPCAIKQSHACAKQLACPELALFIKQFINKKI